MNETFLLGLVQNAALLLALVIVFDTIGLHFQRGQISIRQFPSGIIIGAIGLGVMLTPWTFVPGIVFDTRSILLSISGLFFGTFPTLFAMLITAAFRIIQGGGGALTGVLVILATGSIGIAWRHLCKHSLAKTSWKELILFGLVTHLVMLALMLTLPAESALKVLSNITLPVLTIYPLGTALLGKLMISRLQREQLTRDLQEREDQLRLAHTSVQKSEEQYRLLTESIKDVVWILDVETMHFRYVSPSVERMRGFTAEEVLAQPVTAALDPDAAENLIDLTRNRAQDLLSGKLSTDQFFTNEVEQPCKDGSTIWTELITSYYINPATGRVEVRGVARDISDRKQAENALKESNEKLELLFNLLPVGITVHNRERKITRTNPALEKMLHLSADRLFSGDYLNRRYFRPDGSLMPPSEFASSRIYNGESQALHVEIGVELEDKSLVWIDVSAVACGFSDWRAVLVTSDITQRKQTEAQLNDQIEELRRWHAATLGREDRILELKREINQMLAETGKPARYSSAEDDNQHLD